jgi:hypothetical protein
LDCKFEIKDICDNIVLTGETNNGKINVEKLSSGLFFLRIKKENTFRKFIKL